MAVFIVLAMMPLLSSGCGPVGNLVSDNSPKAFGGIHFDEEFAIRTFVHQSPVDKKSHPGLSDPPVDPSSIAINALTLAYMAADIPFSLIGDAITYPLAYWLDTHH
jgi:uncharacterized protein YceK